MDGLLSLNYWQRLKICNLLSIQRRLERYVLIYTWKCIENLFPNCGFETKFTDRKGRFIPLRPMAKADARTVTLRENSFLYLWS